MSEIRVLKIKVSISFHDGKQIDFLSFIEDFEIRNDHETLMSALQEVYPRALESARSKINKIIQINGFNISLLSDTIFTELAEL